MILSQTVSMVQQIFLEDIVIVHSAREGRYELITAFPQMPGLNKARLVQERKGMN